MTEIVDYEIATANTDLGPPPKLRRKLVVLPEWPNPRGKANAFYECELSTGEHSRVLASHREYDEHGQIVKVLNTGGDVRLLQATTRDGSWNKVWPTVEKAHEVLDGVGRSVTNKLIEAANWANYDGADNPDEASKSAEGNSETSSPKDD